MSAITPTISTIPNLQAQSSTKKTIKDEIQKICKEHPLVADQKREIAKLLTPFKAATLPPAIELGLSQADWLDIYWSMKGEERGNPLTDEEKAWNVPKTSDPLGWSDELWASLLD